jgi:hypothetical protein
VSVLQCVLCKAAASHVHLDHAASWAIRAVQETFRHAHQLPQPVHHHLPQRGCECSTRFHCLGPCVVPFTSFEGTTSACATSCALHAPAMVDIRGATLCCHAMIAFLTISSSVPTGLAAQLNPIMLVAAMSTSASIPGKLRSDVSCDDADALTGRCASSPLRCISLNQIQVSNLSAFRTRPHTRTFSAVFQPMLASTHPCGLTPRVTHDAALQTVTARRHHTCCWR